MGIFDFFRRNKKQDNNIELQIDESLRNSTPSAGDVPAELLEQAETQAVKREVSDYDIFLGIACRKDGASAEVLKKSLWLTNDEDLEYQLKVLTDRKLISKKGTNYVSTHTRQADLLFDILAFAVGYEYDYNFYLSPEFAEFLTNAYALQAFGLDDIPKSLSAREALFRLRNDELVVILRYRPFVCRMVRGYFFDTICQYHKLDLKKKRFAKAVKVDMYIMERLIAKQNNDASQVAYGAHFFFPIGEEPVKVELPKVQKLLRIDVMQENPDRFGDTIQNNLQNALESLTKNTIKRRRLSLEVLREYHALCMHGTSCDSELRTHDVEVRNNPKFQTAHHWEVMDKLVEFEKEYETRSSKVKHTLDTLELAAYVYNEFLYIHPFEDGNSRTATLLMAHVLNQFDLKFSIPRSYDYRFLQVTKGAPKRNDDDLFQLLKVVYLSAINKAEFQKMPELA